MSYYYLPIKTMLFLYQIGIIDAWTILQLIVNGGSQYAAIVAAELADQNSTSVTSLGPKVLFVFAPILGLAKSYQWINQGENALDVQGRIATIAALFGSGLSTYGNATPGASLASGALIHFQITKMTAAIESVQNTRGGIQYFLEYCTIPSLQEFVLKPNQIRNIVLQKILSPLGSGFQANFIPQNIFAKHAERRSRSGLALKPANLNTKTVVKITIGQALSSYALGIGVFVGGVISGLFLFREARQKHYKMMLECHQTVIDVEIISSNYD